MQKNVLVVIPNWNGAEDLPACIDSILAQSYKHLMLVVVDNGSSDSSRQVIESYTRKDPRVQGIFLDKNYGYTGGVNPGIELAIHEGVHFVAPFNNDARADKKWLACLVQFLEAHPEYGIAASAILHADGKTIDSTADQYTIWGLPFPRGRDEPASKRFEYGTDIFGASGGASMYRVDVLRKIGMFDQDFFAYYEDIDLSFRAQLAGWKVGFVPDAIVYHEQGKTSARIADREVNDSRPTSFLTTQYMKNIPFVLVKNVPASLLIRVLPRLILAYTIMFLYAIIDHRGGGALKGVTLFWIKFPKKLWQRRKIQRTRKVSSDYLWGIFVHDLPPSAHKLRRLRSFFGR